MLQDDLFASIKENAIFAIYLNLNNSLLGLFVPFAKSGKALVFASMVTLVFGHWMSIGSIVHFPHPPVRTFYSGNNLIMPYNCSIGSPPMVFPPNQQKTGDKR